MAHTLLPETSTTTSPPPAAEVTAAPIATRWPLWQRIAFRFFAIYFILDIAPWTWILGKIPFVPFAVMQPFFGATDWLVQLANDRLFHVRETLVPPNGSGDTSWAWAQFYLHLLLATIGTLGWSLLDRRRPSYTRAAYWLRTLLRFYLASFAIIYGTIKVLPVQMPFPGLSNLATPLGDLLPMRLSWLFIGYSAPYQIFSGAVELTVGLLLLWRRTVTLGVVLAVAAFANVLVINLAYDVPVKLFASHLFVMSCFLLALDAPRLIRFFVLNQPVTGTRLYDPPALGARARWAWYAAKAFIVYAILLLPSWQTYQRAKTQLWAKPTATPLAIGVYDVTKYVVNGDTLPALVSDTVRWRDFIIDSPAGGTVGSTDPRFWQRYRRGYFRYKADTTARTLALWRTSFAGDSTHIFTAKYALVDSTGARLWTTLGTDSLYVELARSARHFQLAEKQFHWLSEYNR